MAALGSHRGPTDDICSSDDDAHYDLNVKGEFEGGYVHGFNDAAKCKSGWEAKRRLDADYGDRGDRFREGYSRGIRDAEVDSRPISMDYKAERHTTPDLEGFTEGFKHGNSGAFGYRVTPLIIARLDAEYQGHERFKQGYIDGFKEGVANRERGYRSARPSRVVPMTLSTEQHPDAVYSSDEDSSYKLIDAINEGDIHVDNKQLDDDVIEKEEETSDQLVAPTDEKHDEKSLETIIIAERAIRNIRYLEMLNQKQNREIEALKKALNKKQDAINDKSMTRDVGSEKEARDRESKILIKDQKVVWIAIMSVLLALFVGAQLCKKDPLKPIDVNIRLDIDDFFMGKDLQLKLTQDDQRIIDQTVKKAMHEEHVSADLKKNSPAVFEKMEKRDKDRIAKIRHLGTEARQFANNLVSSAKWLRYVAKHNYLSELQSEYKAKVLGLHEFKKLSVQAKQEFEKQFPVTTSIFEQVVELQTLELETRPYSNQK